MLSESVRESRKPRQSRRRQSKPEFYEGQTLVISKFPWPTPQTRLVEIEDVKEVSYAHINSAIPNGVWFHLRNLDTGALSIVGYTELARRCQAVLS